ncbi:uncharacterized protein LOC127246846 [Andrographis paniculata]|uniref:uncharacterized protein LOC127246846 n=1 Tax=Andrographis paniculata TaxID=175694 RepID=UPI0021E91E20|nr:uncharacterized protein LOC127246846 [Andrographis paniculata]
MAACTDEDQQNQQPNFKHYCRVCKKGFMCGRALGGHMRAHGIGDDNGSLSDDDPGSDWEDKIGAGAASASAAGTKRMYQLRTNPNRLKSCRNCENCGKEFLSWKSFLEHGKCSWGDASDSLISPPDSDAEDDGAGGRRGWSKRRRSLRSKVGCVSSNYSTSDEDDLLLARCLVQLANTPVSPPVLDMEESSASASREEERRNPSGGSYFRAAAGKAASKGVFECKACNKVFNSHQALGGHRASHKKVKGCYAAKQDQSDQDNVAINSSGGGGDYSRQDNNADPNTSFRFEQGPAALVGAARRKSKVHECSICHRVFTSGQALGGHKRCHWITSNAALPAEKPASLPKFLLQDTINADSRIIHPPPKAPDISGKLDLNIPAWADIIGVRRDPHNPLSFEVSTEMHLQPWIGNSAATNKDNITNYHRNHNVINEIKCCPSNADADAGAGAAVEDEADSKLKLAKLSDLNDLKEMGSNENSSQWLQVGIGSPATSEPAAGTTIAAKNSPERSKVFGINGVPTGGNDQVLEFYVVWSLLVRGCSNENFRSEPNSANSHNSYRSIDQSCKKTDLIVMEERHRCKVCCRSFGSGRALGGHMRSHVPKISASPEKWPEFEEDEDEDEFLLDSPSSSEEEVFSGGGNLVQDRESETESSRGNSGRRRSKRVRKSRISDFAAGGEKKLKEVGDEQSAMEGEPVSSISDTTPEEHVAHCLIMLSRDKWTRRREDDGDGDGGGEVIGKMSKVKAKYRCETCKKVFRSYQALGGHRASHNKVKVNSPEKLSSSSSPAPAVEKIHQCPFCHRIFPSGQALGGHKRSHFAGGAVPAGSNTPKIGEILDIDLNLPAPPDDDENSQIDVSAVSEAEFVH